MKIALTDTGSGVMMQFANSFGATVKGRFVYIPAEKGAGYITGFKWDNGMRMLIRNYHLKEGAVIERTNELAEGQDDIIFLFGGVLPTGNEAGLAAERAGVTICTHTVSSVMEMPSHTHFLSITIAVPRQYLIKEFSNISHTVVKSLLKPGSEIMLETALSAAMVATAAGLLQQPVPETLEQHYFKIKCEEMLCHVIAQLIMRDDTPAVQMHIADIKAIYRIKLHLESNPHRPPDIAGLAAGAGMSQPKLRKLFKQAFGKGIFEYYQAERMQEAARLLTEEHLSVSETGYRLGFSNLSHFARVFKEHTGCKPKKYAVAGSKSLT